MRERIPDYLLVDCPETPLEVIVNGDLPRKINSLRGDLASCNIDKATLRTWNEGAP